MDSSEERRVPRSVWLVRGSSIGRAGQTPAPPRGASTDHYGVVSPRGSTFRGEFRSRCLSAKEGDLRRARTFDDNGMTIERGKIESRLTNANYSYIHTRARAYTQHVHTHIYVCVLTFLSIFS